jgi:hypothetical protein
VSFALLRFCGYDGAYIDYTNEAGINDVKDCHGG